MARRGVTMSQGWKDLKTRERYRTYLERDREGE